MRFDNPSSRATQIAHEMGDAACMVFGADSIAYREKKIKII